MTARPEFDLSHTITPGTLLEAGQNAGNIGVALGATLAVADASRRTGQGLPGVERPLEQQLDRLAVRGPLERILARSIRQRRLIGPGTVADAVQWARLCQPGGWMFRVTDGVPALLRLGAVSGARGYLDFAHCQRRHHLARQVEWGCIRRDDPATWLADLRPLASEQTFPFSFALWGAAVDAACALPARRADLSAFVDARWPALPEDLRPLAQAWRVRLQICEAGEAAGWKALALLKGGRHRLAVRRWIESLISRGPVDTTLLRKLFFHLVGGPEIQRLRCEAAQSAAQAGQMEEAGRLLHGLDADAPEVILAALHLALARGEAPAPLMEALDQLDARRLTRAHQTAVSWLRVALMWVEGPPVSGKRCSSIRWLLRSHEGRVKALGLAQRAGVDLEVAERRLAREVPDPWWPLARMAVALDMAVQRQPPAAGPQASWQTSRICQALADEHQLLTGACRSRQAARRASASHLAEALTRSRAQGAPVAAVRLRVLRLLGGERARASVAHHLNGLPEGHWARPLLTETLMRLDPVRAPVALLSELGPSAQALLERLTTSGHLPRGLAEAWSELWTALAQAGVDASVWLKGYLRHHGRLPDPMSLKTLTRLVEVESPGPSAEAFMASIGTRVNRLQGRPVARVIEHLVEHRADRVALQSWAPARLPPRMTAWSDQGVREVLKQLNGLLGRVSLKRVEAWADRLGWRVSVETLLSGRWPGGGEGDIPLGGGLTLHWLDPRRDLLTWLRLADSTANCFNSTGPYYWDGMTTGQYVAAAWADPLWMAFQVRDAEARPVGFSFGGYGLVEHQPALALSGIYLKHAWQKSHAPLVARAIMARLCRPLGLTRLVIGPRCGMEERWAVEELCLERWRALTSADGRLVTSTYDDLGRETNDPGVRWVRFKRVELASA